MGAEASLLAQELAEEIAKHQGKTTESERTRHAWDPKDKSPNITLNDDKTKAVRTDAEGGVDAVRGVMTYTRGVHLIEFEWTPGKNKYVAIGVSTTSAPIKSEGNVQLLGSTDQSVGWNMVTRQIYFNGCETGKFPKDVSADYQVPSNVTMVLNMDEGTLTFKADSDKIGVAMKGLKHLGEKLYIVAAMNKPWETVKVKYLGTLDSLQKHLQYQSGELTFHELHGKQAVLGNDGKTAARKDSSENVCNATVLTGRTVKEGEAFIVRLDKINEKYSNSWSVGLTTVAPIEMKFVKDMSKNDQGKTWLCSGNKVYFQREPEERLSSDLDKLGIADTVGIKKENKAIKIYVNGSHEATVNMTEDADVYGFVDLYGRARQVTIMDGTKSGSMLGTSSSSKKLPRTEGEFQEGVVQLITMLKNKDKAKIPDTRKAIIMNLQLPFDLMKSDAIRMRCAEFLAHIKGSATAITEYLKFLWDAIQKGTEAANCYMSLLDCAIGYSGKSIALSRQFGESGLVQTALHGLSRIKSDAVQISEFGKLTVTKLLRLLQNCARVSDNQSTYRKMDFEKMSQGFLDKNSDNYKVVVPIISTLCFLVDDDKPPVISTTNTNHVLNILQKAVQSKHSDASHHFEGWYAYETAMCIGMLGQNLDNLKNITTDDGVFRNLVMMLGFEEDKDKECAANTLWSLAADFNYLRLFKIPKFLEHLKELVTGGPESVQQAVRRLTLKLNNLREQKKTSSFKSCSYLEKCTLFMKALKVEDAYLDQKYDKCYCVDCHSKRSDKAYYNRGQPPKTHAIPVGWVRFGLKAPARAFANKAHTEWHTAYHGTKKEHIPKILDVGYLVPAGREVIGGVNINEGSKHFSDDWKPVGFDTKQVFISPSIRYAGVNAYARPSSFALKDLSGKQVAYSAKVAFQVLIKPGSYKVGNETIGATQVIDPGFSNQELEWSTTQDGATILNAVLVKVEKI